MILSLRIYFFIIFSWIRFCCLNQQQVRENSVFWQKFEVIILNDLIIFLKNFQNFMTFIIYAAMKEFILLRLILNCYFNFYLYFTMFLHNLFEIL